ncbi:MAG: RNA-binding protein [Gammaproteobacteria bacterium]|nr:RNA-binding protein [Gammaproteobacteria bacterium]
MTRLRIDIWLWAARFYKTRALAGEAVAGGKVHVNGHRVKAAKLIQPDDGLEITRGVDVFVVIINAVNNKRRPAKEAQLLYTETEQSILKREENAMQRKLVAQMHPAAEHRPSKRDRRKIIRFVRKQ